MANSNGDGFLQRVVGMLGFGFSRILRLKLQLARKEAAEQAEKALEGCKLLAIGAVIANAAAIVLLAAAVSALSSVFLNAGMDPMTAIATSALIVALVAGALAAVFIVRGADKVRDSKAALDKTVSTIIDESRASMSEVADTLQSESREELEDRHEEAARRQRRRDDD